MKSVALTMIITVITPTTTTTTVKFSTEFPVSSTQYVKINELKRTRKREENQKIRLTLGKSFFFFDNDSTFGFNFGKIIKFSFGKSAKNAAKLKPRKFGTIED